MDSVSEEFKIVVVDDSPVYRKLVGDALGQKSYVTLIAKDGKEALDLIAAHHPAVVLTDWEMPDISGIDLCRHIRSEQQFYTYVILLTSNNQKDQVIEGLATGADDYLTKPFHPGELLARVTVGLRIADLHRQLQAKNSLLEELSLTDPLTGLSNRRALEQWGARELMGALRHRFGFWVVMADIDRFKSVNDTYGHNAGDVVLKKFADILRTNTRASNMCGRIGGEEFVILLSHTAKEDAATAVDRLRTRLEQEKFTFGGQDVRITSSFGIAGLSFGENIEFSALVSRADGALYEAKRNGRNRVEFAKI